MRAQIVEVRQRVVASSLLKQASIAAEAIRAAMLDPTKNPAIMRGGDF